MHHLSVHIPPKALATKTLLVLATCLLLPTVVLAGLNMIGRQSQNEGMQVVPAPGKVVIDGDLKDWDVSGRIWAFADSAIRNRYSVEVAAMWDQKYLYLAAHWKDPTPMYNTVDPEFNPTEGWKSDAWQMRIKSDKNCWITTWFFTPKKVPVMHISDWKNPARDKDGQDVTLLRADEGGVDLGHGVEMAYKTDEDGKGFVQEVKIPWNIIYREPPSIAAGLTFRMGQEFMWGDPTGKTWPVHRYADNMQPGQTSREFFWTATNSWGDMRLVDKGNLTPRQYVDEEGKLRGAVPLRLTVPKAAARFTVAINDAAGKRVRNLGGDLLPEEYADPQAGTAADGSKRVVVPWDGLDDNGRLVPPGEYKVVGLAHEGLGAEYQMCFYNPGTPPWDTRNGSGAWGADHSAPHNVAAAGEWTIVSWGFAEGGHGIIALDAKGKKRWGEKRGATILAADADHVYAFANAWNVKNALCRLSAKDGSYKPFVLDGKPRPFELKFADLFGDAVAADDRGTALAVGDGRLLLGLASGKIAVLDAASAKLIKMFDAPDPSAVAFGGGKLYAISDGKLCAVDIDAGKLATIATPGLGKAGAIAVDGEGNIAVADRGPDSQVKVYSPAGRLVYTCGKKGGRPIRGAFDEQAMMRVSSVAVDARGEIWAVESWEYPRRVSVWNKQGQLVRDYVGNTGYAGTGCYLHDTDPTRAYVGPIELKIDLPTRSWKVASVLWVPDVQRGESFPVGAGSHVMPQRFTSSASGKAREYLYAHDPRDGGGQVVYMDRGGRWQPVAAVCLAGHVSGGFAHNGDVIAPPSGELDGCDSYDGVFWNDTNRDGKVQRNECEILPCAKPKNPKSRPTAPLSLTNGWGGRIGKDLVFYTAGLTRYKPIGFADDGAPLYGSKGMEQMDVAATGDLVPVVEEDRILCLKESLVGIDAATGAIQWTYPNPFPSVHGSHRATMPKPGLLIGPLRIVGVADVGQRVGRVLLLRGNLGQDFYLTTDGLFVGAMFQDGRLPSDPLPATEEQLVGMPMESLSGGGEPFNGWFGKQADGKIRMTNGLARQAGMILEIKGLDSIRRFTGSAVQLSQKDIIKADEDNAARAVAAVQAKNYAIRPAQGKFVVDGKADEWKELPAAPLERSGQPNRGTVKLAYDDQRLFALLDVRDANGWQNEGKDFSRLFKTGAAVDLQLCVDPAATKDAKRAKVGAGDVRVVIAPFEGKPAAVVMKPVDLAAGAALKKEYVSPVGAKVFDRVEVIAGAKVMVNKSAGRYLIEIAIPLEAIGLKPSPGLVLRGDMGFISADAAGQINTARTYWANPNTNLVNDLPLEAWLSPNAWGQWTFE